MPTAIDTADVLVVGGGSAGAVLAERIFRRAFAAVSRRP
jgi:choline dehydrogenase-like flavoprotein